MPGLALLTRSFGQRVMKDCDTFTVPRRAQAAGRIHPAKRCADAGAVSTSRDVAAVTKSS